jgi:hypothetical protein
MIVYLVEWQSLAIKFDVSANTCLFRACNSHASECIYGHVKLLELFIRILETQMRLSQPHRR